MARFVLALLLLAAPAAAQKQSDAVESVQQQILADPELAAQVMELRDDPEVQGILNDPEIMDAINRGDMGALMSNPKIQRLAEDPAVQDVTRSVK
jgi:hypothetical protein